MRRGASCAVPQFTTKELKMTTHPAPATPLPTHIERRIGRGEQQAARYGDIVPPHPASPIEKLAVANATRVSDVVHAPQGEIGPGEIAKARFGHPQDTR
jgi:hypothetical protein